MVQITYKNVINKKIYLKDSYCKVKFFKFVKQKHVETCEDSTNEDSRGDVFADTNVSVNESSDAIEDSVCW